MSESVRVERFGDSDSGIVELKLGGPEAKNAIGKEMLRRLQFGSRCFLRRDGSQGCHLLAGQLNWVDQNLEESDLLKLVESQEALSVPTIAVIEGAALGGGLELALSCDLRVCGEDSTFSWLETALAIIPRNRAGGTRRLPRVVGRSAAKELIFTGQRINSEEDLSMGLINHCVPSGEAYHMALCVDRDINQKGPLATRMT